MSWRFSGTEAHTLVKRWLLQRATETFKTCQTFSFGNWCATIFNSSLFYHLINHMQRSGQKCCWWMGVWNFKSHCGKAEILIFNPTFFSCFNCSSAVLLSFVSIIVSIGPAFVFNCPRLFRVFNQPSLAAPSEGYLPQWLSVAKFTPVVEEQLHFSCYLDIALDLLSATMVVNSSMPGNIAFRRTIYSSS